MIPSAPYAIEPSREQNHAGMVRAACKAGKEMHRHPFKNREDAPIKGQEEFGNE
jgi:hypothetical protein